MKKIVLTAVIMVLAAAILVGAVSAEDNATAVKGKVTGYSDLPNAIIGVQLGTTGDELVTDFEKLNNTKIERYNKGADAVQALKTGKVDCVVIDSLTAVAFIDKNKDLKIIDEGFELEQYALAFKKGNTELVEAVNQALKELEEAGVIKQINENFIPTSEKKGTCPYVSPENVERTKGTLVVATNAEFPPYEYYESGKITGIDMQIMQAVCDKLGYTMKIEDMNFDSVITAVSTGKADVGAAALSITDDRKKNVDFSNPYTTTQQVIIVKDESGAAKTPAPILGLLAGLGAAAVLLRRF